VKNPFVVVVAVLSIDFEIKVNHRIDQVVEEVLKVMIHL
jgi:hypothetical protein